MRSYVGISSTRFRQPFSYLYSRPFVTGVRKWLGEEGLKVLDSQQRKKHERLRAFRDKHIAHSVNAFEENQPVARYWLERVKDEGITSIECNHTRIIGMSSADLEDVIELSTAMLSYVEARLKEEKRVLEIVRQIPVEQILARPTIGTSDSRSDENPIGVARGDDF